MRRASQHSPYDWGVLNSLAELLDERLGRGLGYVTKAEAEAVLGVSPAAFNDQSPAAFTCVNRAPWCSRRSETRPVRRSKNDHLKGVDSTRPDAAGVSPS